MHTLGSSWTHTTYTPPPPNPLRFETQVDVWPRSACELGVTHQGAGPTIQSKKREKTLLIGSFHGASLEAAEFSVL